MELTEFTEKFIDFIKTLKLRSEFEFYLFGSILNKEHYNDIDILVIYSDFVELKDVKDLINRKFQHKLPHLTCLSRSEEMELNFIEMTNSRKIKTTDNNGYK